MENKYYIIILVTIVLIPAIAGAIIYLNLGNDSLVKPEINATMGNYTNNYIETLMEKINQ